MRCSPSARRRVALCLLVIVGLAGNARAAKGPEIVGCRLGLGDRYKLGCWAPVRLDVIGGEQPLGVGAVVVASDNDGAGVATTTPGGRPLSTEPGRTTRASLYARVGRTRSPLMTRIVAGGRAVDQRQFEVDDNLGYLDRPGEVLSEPVPATERLYLQLSGPSDNERAEMLRDLEVIENAYGGGDGVHAAFVHDPEELPKEAIGYDSFDVVLLIAGDESADWLAGLPAGDLRVRALADWVRSGGRLVLSCGAAGDALLSPGGPLAELCPGEYAGPGSLASAAAIDTYTDASEEIAAIDLGGTPLRVSKLVGVRGGVEAFGGRDQTESPLVVRSPLGFGEVTFVAFDLDAPAIGAWKGRSALLKRLLRYRANPQDEGYYWHGQDREFVHQLIGRLDESFSGVRTPPFLLIVGLVLGYLVLIGPGDYFFVKNVLKRVEATWVTFPLIVILTSSAAYFGAYWMKGDQLRVSQVEVVDIDAAAGFTRGSLFTHLFSPRSTRYDVSLVTESLAGESLQPQIGWTSWLGKPGWGLGGMGNPGARLGSLGYRMEVTPGLAAGGTGAGERADVAGLPIPVWSTKTLLSRYLAKVDRSFQSQLIPDGEGLVIGSVTNDTGAALDDCWLLYGSWSWNLGSLAEGETKSVDPSVTTVKITTMMRDYSPADSFRGAIDEATLSRREENWNEVSRYLGDLDLSYRLDAGDALLIAAAKGEARTRLVGVGGVPLVGPDDAGSGEELGPAGKSWVFVRAVLPVGEQE